MRMLHLADLHLGWRPAFMPEGRAQERQRRRDELLARAVDFALAPENRVELVVVAGDLFETHRPSPALVEAVLRELRRLQQAGLPVVTVPGNHDEITYHDSVYRLHGHQWPGVLVQQALPGRVATVATRSGPVHVYSLAYTGGVTPAREPLAHFPRVDEPGVHLGVFHGTLGAWGGERSLPLDGAALGRAGYDYVALGHIHRHRVERLGRTVAAYSGAVEGKGADDPGVGHWTVADVEPGAVARVQAVPVAVQPVKTVSLDAGAFESPAHLQAAVAAAADPQAIVFLELTGLSGFEVDAEALAASLQDRFFFLEVVDRTEGLAPELLERLAGEPTILGLFVRRMQARLAEATEERQRRLALQALRAGVAALREAGAL